MAFEPVHVKLKVGERGRGGTLIVNDHDLSDIASGVELKAHGPYITQLIITLPPTSSVEIDVIAELTGFEVQA